MTYPLGRHPYSCVRQEPLHSNGRFLRATGGLLPVATAVILSQSRPMTSEQLKGVHPAPRASAKGLHAPNLACHHRSIVPQDMLCGVLYGAFDLRWQGASMLAGVVRDGESVKATVRGTLQLLHPREDNESPEKARRESNHRELCRNPRPNNELNTYYVHDSY